MFVKMVSERRCSSEILSICSCTLSVIRLKFWESCPNSFRESTGTREVMLPAASDWVICVNFSIGFMMAPVLRTLNTIARMSPATLAIRTTCRRLPIAVLTASIGSATRQMPINVPVPFDESSVPALRYMGIAK